MFNAIITTFKAQSPYPRDALILIVAVVASVVAAGCASTVDWATVSGEPTRYVRESRLLELHELGGKAAQLPVESCNKILPVAIKSGRFGSGWSVNGPGGLWVSWNELVILKEMRHAACSCKEEVIRASYAKSATIETLANRSLADLVAIANSLNQSPAVHEAVRQMLKERIPAAGPDDLAALYSGDRLPGLFNTGVQPDAARLKFEAPIVRCMGAFLRVPDDRRNGKGPIVNQMIERRRQTLVKEASERQERERQEAFAQQQALAEAERRRTDETQLIVGTGEGRVDARPANMGPLEDALPIFVGQSWEEARVRMMKTVSKVDIRQLGGEDLIAGKSNFPVPLGVAEVIVIRSPGDRRRVTKVEVNISLSGPHCGLATIRKLAGTNWTSWKQTGSSDSTRITATWRGERNLEGDCFKENPKAALIRLSDSWTHLSTNRSYDFATRYFVSVGELVRQVVVKDATWWEVLGAKVTDQVQMKMQKEAVDEIQEAFRGVKMLQELSPRARRNFDEYRVLAADEKWVMEQILLAKKTPR